MRWARVGPAIAVAAAVLVMGVLAVTNDDGSRSGDASEPTPEPTEISSDAPRFASLADLAAASDLVVRGHVASTERGRTFGDPGGTVIESRLVRLVVDDVLRGGPGGDDPAIGAAITIEEPGRLDDGTPLIVDGVPPTATGDEVVWFLTAVPSPALDRADDAPAYVLVGPQGHYRVEGARLVPAAGNDALSTELAGLGLDGLAAAVRALVALPSP